MKHIKDEECEYLDIVNGVCECSKTFEEQKEKGKYQYCQGTQKDRSLCGNVF